MLMKKCVECLEVKELKEFYDNKRAKGGKTILVKCVVVKEININT